MKKKAKGSPAHRNLVLQGIAASPGIAVGQAFLYVEHDLEPEPRVIQPSEVDSEIQRFRESVERASQYLKSSKEQLPPSYGKDVGKILSIQLDLLQDEFFLAEVENTIRQEKLDAAYATFVVFKKKKEKLLAAENEYLRDRAFDIHALKKLILKNLMGEPAPLEVGHPAIVVAEEIGPADMVRLHRQSILGLATNTGGRTSHTAIIARSLSVPAVVGLGNVTEKVENGELIVLDGYEGCLIVDPEPQVVRRFRERKKKLVVYEKKLREESRLETRTRDGVPVQVAANIEFEEELGSLKEVFADGVGLFRTEGIFLNRDSLPTEDEQTRVYREVARMVAPNPCTIRTIDVGGDKVLRWLVYTEERNPFLGWRAIRFWLDHPQYFLVQLKAMLRANEPGNIRILLPMISGLEEVYKVQELLAEAQRQLREEGKPFNPEISLGIMVEIPSTAILADLFAREVDFFSIGTNDLVQYTLAVDRGNEKVARLYSYFHPAVLRLVEQVIHAGKRQGIEVSMCGEMAADGRAIPLLLGAGLRHFSCASALIPEVKKIIRNLSVAECRELFERLKGLKTTQEIREAAEAFYRQKVAALVEVT
ncbi:MAG: phosphoenolpyruvate--protein phosphotransferase [Calditrichaeota bacterium]|nr:MAG: phosphoenolpyruvate--protein phosphotransferase [Calditrichota bacterium]